MITANSPILEQIRMDGMHEILSSPGPSITVILPPCRPGELAATSAALLKVQVHHAERLLAERGVSETEAADLLAPLQYLTEDTTLFSGSQWGRAIFRSPTVYRHFQVMQPIRAKLTVASCFAIRALLPELSLPSEFYVLELSKKRISLLRCTPFHATPVGLPEGVPQTLEEALQLEAPDHDLENRSFAGTSMGAMRAVRFGTGSGRETQHAHLGDFYKLVDRGMRKLLHGGGTPLVLAGVDEDTALYRSISACPTLVPDSIHGSPTVSTQEAEIVRKGYALIHAECVDREIKAWIEAKERLAPARFSTELRDILRAAFEGRVMSLSIDETARRTGEFAMGEYRSWGTEDLLNLAAVQTILHNGKVVGMPNDRLPGGAAVAAQLRF